MESVSNNSPIIYGQVEKFYYTNDGNVKQYEKRVITGLPAGQDTNKSSYKVENNINHNAIATLTGITAMSIPVVNSIITGAKVKGDTADKTIIALQKGKSWGAFLAVSYLFNSAANLIINKIKPLRNFRDNNPGITSAGVLIGSLVTGSTAMDYALNHMRSDSLINNNINNISVKIAGNKTFKKVVDNISKFADSPTGRRTGTAAMIGVGILAVNSLISWGKPRYK